MWFSSDEYYIGRPPFSSTRRGVAHLCTFPPSGWVFGACTARHRSPRRSWWKPGVERFQAAGRGLPRKVWRVSAAEGLAGVRRKRSGRCPPQKFWQVSAAEGLAGISRRRSGGYPPQTVWQGSAAEGLAGVRRGGIGSDLPGLNAQGELG